MATDCAAFTSTLLQLDEVVGVYQPHCQFVVSVAMLSGIGVVITVPFADPVVGIGASLRIGIRDVLAACAHTPAALATRRRAAAVIEDFILFTSVAAFATGPPLRRLSLYAQPACSQGPIVPEIRVSPESKVGQED
jgi:hypothetical protein